MARRRTDGVQAKDVLQESEAHYRLLAENATDLITRHAPDGACLYASPACQSLLGCTAEELIHGTVIRFHPEDASAVAAAHAALIDGRDDATAVYRIRRKDGRYIWFETRSRAIRDPQTRALVEIHCASRDITARKEAEELLQTVIANAPVALTAVDADGIVTFSSGRGLEGLGRAPNSSVGRSIFDVLAEAPDAQEHVRQALAGAYDIATVPLGGRVFEVRYVPMCDGDGRITGAVGVSTDITERVQAEEARRASDGRFRQLVELAQEGIWQFDKALCTTYVNRKMADILGYAPEEMLGRPFWDFTDEEGRALAAETITLYPRGHAEPREYRFMRRDGMVVWALLTTAPLHDATGERVGAFTTVTDITARKQEEDRLRHIAHHDALTGLPNRAFFADRLAQEVHSTDQRACTLAVLLLDLDRFKWVNDTLGHAIGDTLLRAVADRLRGTLRESDTVARLGGDEFAFILPDTDEEGAVATARKLLAALAMPVELDGCRVDVAGSLGIALSPAHGTDRASLLRCADVAMYQAKRSRRGHAVYAPGQDEHTPERLTLAADLREAVAGGELVLHYQPVVDGWTGTVQRMEALVRWAHPTRGLLPPGTFLPLAEETGISASLEDWVLVEAVRQCAAWQLDGLEVGVAINISLTSLRDKDLPTRIETLLARHSLPAEQLTLEVTEGAVMAHPEQTAATLDYLRQLGVRLALDDFGTGYSSLARLQHLPVDEIKVDRSFVAAMAGDEDAATIVTFLLGLGRALRRSVVAEGVETEEVRQALVALGCDALQGYAIARPLPAARAAAWLRRHHATRPAELRGHRAPGDRYGAYLDLPLASSE